MGKNKKQALLIVALVLIGIVSDLIYINLIENKNLNKSIAIYLSDSTGSYTLSDLTKIPESGYTFSKSICTNGGTVTWDETNKNISVSTNKQEKCNLYFDLKVYSGANTLAALGLKSKTGTPDFNTRAATDETADGLYSMEDDYGTSYYFRGAVENNYVKFANFFWRIIRINGDGSLRLIYDGKSAYANGTSTSDRIIKTGYFNANYRDNAYIGYMYGLAETTTDANRCLVLENNVVTDKISTYASKNACEAAGGKWTTTAYEATHANVKNSNIKTVLDTWYKTNIVDTGYEKYVSDEIFCNDRSISTDLGYGTNKTKYGTFYRVTANKSPKLTCSQKNDAFTVSDTVKGNGDLTYSVGLITGDEVIVSGGRDGSPNADYYLYKGQWYWLLSPYSYNIYLYGYAINSGGNVSYSDVNESYLGIAPVINLSAKYAETLKGKGTMTNPYTVS